MRERRKVGGEKSLVGGRRVVRGGVRIFCSWGAGDDDEEEGCERGQIVGGMELGRMWRGWGGGKMVRGGGGKVEQFPAAAVAAA